MASTSYSCAECGAPLNLSPSNLYPADFYFEAGNKGTLSFSVIDSSRFRLEKEDKIKPFFETQNYWGIERKGTNLKCISCGKLIGYIYDDGPPATAGIGQFGMASLSQSLDTQIFPKLGNTREHLCRTRT